jgi:glycosyltransferase involved in cell wall biosynthesis
MNTLKKLIPSFLKKPVAIVYITGRCLLRGMNSKKIVLNLAGVLPPIGSDKIVHGGKIKLLHLREKFGDSWQRFNVAYFVSSGLPFAPEWWIRIYKFFGVKVVWNQNGVAYPALYPYKVVDNVNALMKPIHLVDYVVYQTEFVKRCADKYLGIFKGSSSVIINPVDTDHFVPNKTPLPREPLVIIIAGNHFESKERMTVSLSVIKKLIERGLKTKLIIIGHTNEEADKEIARLGLSEHISKTGSFLQKDAPSLFQSAHILLHLKYLDPCPTIVLEALSCGLPVVGSASGGLPEMIDEQSGILIPIVEDFETLHYPSVDAVADAIQKIYVDYPEWSAHARAGAVGKFGTTSWLNKHEKIFHELIE